MRSKNIISAMVLSIFAFSTVMLSLMGHSAVSVVAETIVAPPVFDDVGYESGYYLSTQYLYDHGAVEGYSDGTFRAEANINRAEFLRIVMDAAKIEVDGSDCYSDVHDEWFASYVCKATELGYVSGDSGKNTFRPAASVNFAEASKIVVNVLGVELVKSDKEDAWYSDFVVSLAEVNAIPASVSSFSHNLTRGEMAEMVYRISDNITDDVSNSYANLVAGKKIFDPKFAAMSGGLDTFASCEDMTSYVDYVAATSYSVYDDFDLAQEDVATPTVQESSDKGGGDGGVDYSSTNVQVEGVDEADIVKTDGEYIYVLKDSSVRIVRAYTPDKLEELGSIDFGDENSWSANDMYIDGDKLVVVSSTYGYIYYGLDAAKIAPDYYGGEQNMTDVYIYDISNKSEPKLDRKVTFEGNYLSSRKVDDTVYLVSQKYSWGYSEGPIIPLTRDSATNDSIEESSTCSSVYYDPQSRSSTFTIVAAVPVDDSQKAVDEEVILSGSTEIYASRDNLYIADATFNWDWAYEGDEETKIHKFSLDGNKIEHVADAKVEGTILNQFSMDESDGDFRIATTLGDTWNGTSSNNVYVLDEDLTQVGTLEGIAAGENIYSTRFVGDRLYMVTFKKVDPFFVIDLGDRKNPKVLGALKIPGYSNYLHPLDEDHIIGFGKDTVDPTDEESNDFWGAVDFAWYQGMKMAIFDVSDVSNPIELHKEIIGDRGTESELLYNHKALMIDLDKGIMAFPVNLAELPDSVAKDPDVPQSAYGQSVYQGAYVYDVSVEDGFELRGRVSHYDEDQLGTAFEYYNYGPKDIQRILYIGDYLYTVSQAMVQANDLGDLDFVNSVELE